jgi:hypothetical protein
MFGKPSPYKISYRTRSILVALMRALIEEPEDLTIHNREEFLLEKAERLMQEFPLFTRFGFLCILYAFDRVTLFFGFGVLRFIHLKPASQKKYVAKWHESKLEFIRELFKPVRGLVMLIYFCHPDVWRYIGYDPESHVAERIKLRQDLLKKRA